MRIFFDVDSTIIAFNGDLRPHVKEVFERLIQDGHELYLWSGVGVRWEVVRQYSLQPYIKDCFLKPLYDYEKGLAKMSIDFVPDFCVDDHEELIEALGGYAIKPYFWVDEEDGEMWKVYEVISAHALERKRDGSR